MSNVEQREHDEQLAMENEIAILRGQVSTLTAAYENAVAQHNKTLDELRASLASAQEGWKHSCNALCMDGVELWIPQCPHCGKPDPTPPVSEDRWLPIATAPKDRFVLLAGPSGYTTIETVFATGRMCSDYHVGRWIDHANDDLTDWGFEPTHWMPLPEAPAMQEDKP